MCERLRIVFLLMLIAVSSGCSQHTDESQALVADKRPNILLIVADDLGYADLGVHGSNIQTPNIDALCEKNFAALQTAGIIPPESSLPPRNDAITPWDELSVNDQRRESRKMELYASMVENLDSHIGHLLDHLKQSGLYENTLIVFMSDNGAAGEDFSNDGRFTEYIQAHFDNAYETMGTAVSFVSYDDPWAEAGSAPFMRRKGYTRAGGIVAPMIVAGPGVANTGSIDSAYVTVIDLAPTLLEFAGVQYPDDGSVRPMLGESMLGFLAGDIETVHSNDYVTTLYHGGRAFLRQGDWKISNLEPPFDEKDFELFDLSADPGETDNLAESQLDKYEELLELWQNTRKELGIILPQDL